MDQQHSQMTTDKDLEDQELWDDQWEAPLISMPSANYWTPPMVEPKENNNG